MNDLDEIGDNLKTKIIEAFIFASKDPVEISHLSIFEKNLDNLNKIIANLQNKYSTSGINLVKIEDCFAFRTDPEISHLLNLEQKISKPLSRAASETLTIIAYHQPITKSKIENIRGVSMGKGTLDILFEIGWIKPSKRLDTPGRPMTWVTTNKFLDHFGLTTITELPGLQELQETGLLNESYDFFSDPKMEQES